MSKVLESPFNRAIKALKRAKRAKAHPSMINRLDLRVKEEADKLIKIFQAAGNEFPVLESLLKDKPLIWRIK